RRRRGRDPADRRGQPRPRAVPEPGALRRGPPGRDAADLRLGDPPLPGGAAGPAGPPDRLHAAGGALRPHRTGGDDPPLLDDVPAGSAVAPGARHHPVTVSTSAGPLT